MSGTGNFTALQWKQLVSSQYCGTGDTAAELPCNQFYSNECRKINISNWNKSVKGMQGTFYGPGFSKANMILFSLTW